MRRAARIDERSLYAGLAVAALALLGLTAAIVDLARVNRGLSRALSEACLLYTSCPRYASLLSAWGIGQARMRAWRQGGLEAALSADGLAAAAAMAESLTAQAAGDLAAQGASVGDRRVTLNLRYDDSDTTLPLPLGNLTKVTRTFEAAHRRLFGFAEPGLSLIHIWWWRR